MISLELIPPPGRMPKPSDPAYLLRFNPKILPNNCKRPWKFIFAKCRVRDFGGRYCDKTGAEWERVTRHFQFGRIHFFTYQKCMAGAYSTREGLTLSFYKQ